jgi:hypothetical protein
MTPRRSTRRPALVIVRATRVLDDPAVSRGPRSPDRASLRDRVAMSQGRGAPATALSWNLLSAVVGGYPESFSILWGLRALAGLARALYAAVFGGPLGPPEPRDTRNFLRGKSYSSALRAERRRGRRGCAGSPRFGRVVNGFRLIPGRVEAWHAGCPFPQARAGVRSRRGRAPRGSAKGGPDW